MHSDEGVPSRFHFLKRNGRDLCGSNYDLSNNLPIIGEFLKFSLFIFRSSKVTGYVCIPLVRDYMKLLL